MITHLIIGAKARVFELYANRSIIVIPHEQHPRQSNVAVEEYFESDREVVIATFSPTVIYQVCSRWRSNFDLDYSRIILRHSNRDTILSTVFEPSWLAHFALEDLYIRGEFDKYLEDQPL
jgi:hypothetical protein